MGGMVAEGNWAVASSQEVEDALGVEDIGGVIGAITPCQWAILGMLPRGGHLQPAPCDPEVGSLSRTPVWILMPRQLPRPWTGHSP